MTGASFVKIKPSAAYIRAGKVAIRSDLSHLGVMAVLSGTPPGVIFLAYLVVL